MSLRLSSWDCASEFPISQFKKSSLSELFISTRSHLGTFDPSKFSKPLLSSYAHYGWCLFVLAIWWGFQWNRLLAMVGVSCTIARNSSIQFHGILHDLPWFWTTVFISLKQLVGKDSGDEAMSKWDQRIRLPTRQRIRFALDNASLEFLAID